MECSITANVSGMPKDSANYCTKKVVMQQSLLTILIQIDEIAIMEITKDSQH